MKSELEIEHVYEVLVAMQKHDEARELIGEETLKSIHTAADALAWVLDFSWSRLQENVDNQVAFLQRHGYGFREKTH